MANGERGGLIGGDGEVKGRFRAAEGEDIVVADGLDCEDSGGEGDLGG